MRTLLIGQAPARTSDPAVPLRDGASGRRLARLVGLGPAEYAEAFDRVNLLDSWPGSAGKGDRFPAALARLAADRLLPALARRARSGGRVVFVGGAVARAFGFEAAPLLWRAWKPGAADRPVIAARLPHPSGVNPWWNDETNRRAAAEFLRSAARGGAG